MVRASLAFSGLYKRPVRLCCYDIDEDIEVEQISCLYLRGWAKLSSYRKKARLDSTKLIFVYWNGLAINHIDMGSVVLGTHRDVVCMMK